MTDEIMETGVRWVAGARGSPTTLDAKGTETATDELDAFLERYGYDKDDVSREGWLAAAVLSELGCGLRCYVERFGGDLREELVAADADARDAMDGMPPTEASRRHDLRHVGYRPPLAGSIECHGQT